jgi:hypothetical protein
MPMDVEIALMYGIKAVTKTRFKFKDLSYRKSLAEWMCLLNSLYPPDSELNIPSHYTDLKSPLGDLGVTNRKLKPFPFPQLETRKGDLMVIKKPYNLLIPKPFAKNNSVISSVSLNAKIIKINNLKISQNTIPFPKQIFACARQIFTIGFHFHFCITKRYHKKTFDFSALTFNLLSHFAKGTNPPYG